VPPELRIPDVRRFDAVDQSGDPAAMVAFLEAAGTMPGLRDVKLALLEQLWLSDARSALDLGCAFGADVAETALRVPAGVQGRR